MHITSSRTPDFKKSASTTGGKFSHKFVLGICSAAICLMILSSNVLAIPLTFQGTAAEREGMPNPEQESSVSQANQAPTRFNLDSIATFSFGTNHGSDCWGWQAPNGDQYAIMGIDAGIVFVNATTLQVADTIPNVGASCVWQDMATVDNYCYSVSECGNGLMVMDMSFLPDSVHFVGTFPINTTGGMSSHNLSIDSLKGFLYLDGSGGASRNVYVHDISNRENPVFVTGFGSNGSAIHDFYANNDTVYVAEGSPSSYSIWDLSNKAAPNLLTRWFSFSGGYAHNIWPTEDGRYVVTTEETPGKTIKVWNIENLGNVNLVAEYLGSSQLAHNVQIRGDIAYVSHYQSGVYMIDLSRPSCAEEVAQFDTWPSGNSSGFAGCWGAFHSQEPTVCTTLRMKTARCLF